MGLSDAFMWFGRSVIGEHAVTYYMNHFLSAFVPSSLCILLLLCIFVGSKLVGSCGCCDGKYKIWCYLYAVWSSLQVLLGLIIILIISWCIQLFVAFALIPIYVGAALMALFWIFCAMHSVRVRRETVAQEQVEERELQQLSYGVQDVDEAEVDIHKTQHRPAKEFAAPEKKETPASIFAKKLATYPRRVLRGLRLRWWIVFLMVIVIVPLSAAISMLSCNLCVASSPIETSSLFTRLVTPKTCRMSIIIVNMNIRMVQNMFLLCHCARRFAHIVNI